MADSPSVVVINVIIKEIEENIESGIGLGIDFFDSSFTLDVTSSVQVKEGLNILALGDFSRVAFI